MTDNRKWLALAVIVAAVVAGLLVAHHSKRQPAAPNYYSVSDSSIGLSFNVSKNFQPINKDELAVLNPGFAYGYRPAGDSRTLCYISVSSLKGSGSATTQQLTNGIVKSVRRNHPNAKAKSVAATSYGQAKGIFVKIAYADGNTKYDRFEALALGKKRQAIAYCQTLSTYLDQYRDDFGILFTSLQLNT